MASSRNTRIIAGTILALLIGFPAVAGTWDRAREVRSCRAFARDYNGDVSAMLARSDRSPGAHRALEQALRQRAVQLRAAPPSFLSPDTVRALCEELESQAEAYGAWADLQESRSTPPRGRKERYERLLGRLRAVQEANRRGFLRDCHG